MVWYDWLILVLPVCFVMYMGFRSRRYVRGVSDFLSAGRLCGRYVISVGDVANALSIIGLVAYIEMHYKTGFSVGFWSSVLTPLGIMLSLTGFANYRFRETRAMSLGQFLEMRYSRRFRVADDMFKGDGRSRDIRLRWTPRTVLRNLVGITPEYTRGDRVVAWSVFLYSLGYGFGLCFLGTVAWNAVSPWPITWWSRYFVVRYFVVPCIVSFVTAVWFGIGGIVGLRQLFRDLKARTETNALDDGRVESNVSLADKAALDKVDAAGREAPLP